MAKSKRIAPFLEPHPLDSNKHPARRAARWYSARLSWASFPDLLHEATEATVKAARTFDPAKGRNIDAYQYRAAIFHLREYLQHEFPAVSVSWRSHKDLMRKRLNGRRIALSVIPFNHAAPIAIDHDDIDPNIRVVREDWKSRVRVRLSELLTDAKHTELAIPVLLGEQTSAHVAECHGVPVQTVYYATLRAKRRAARDGTLRSLLDDTP